MLETLSRLMCSQNFISWHSNVKFSSFPSSGTTVNMAQKPRVIYLLKPVSGINITAVALVVTAVTFY